MGHQGVSKYYEMIVCRISISSLCLYWWLGLLGVVVGGFGGSGAGSGGEVFPVAVVGGVFGTGSGLQYLCGMVHCGMFSGFLDPKFCVVRRFVEQLLYTMLISNNHTYFRLW